MSLNEMILAVSGSLAASILAKVTMTTALALAGARIARNSRAAVRHALLAAAFVLLLVLPIASLVAPTVSVAMPLAVEDAIAPLTPEPMVDATASVDSPSPQSPNLRISESPHPALLPWPMLLLAGWAAGAVVCLIPVAAGLWQMRALRRSGQPWHQGGAVVGSLAREAGIHRRVTVLRHESIPGPMTCGVVRPAILLPEDAGVWATEALNRAIVHELEHVRRGDWASLCSARIVCAVYWFHPLVWVARRQLVLEAERACDDAVLGRSDATAYADQLVVLAARLSTAVHPPQLAMANRHDLVTRVGAVLDSRQRRGRAGALAVVSVVAATALLVTTMSPLRVVAEATATSSQAPASGSKFVVASIKPCAPGESAGGRSGGGGGGFGASPGRIYFQCMPVTEIIRKAYVQFGDPPPPNAPSVFGELIKAAPGWASSDRYTIEAKAEGAPPTTTMMGAMLRSLLADRFQLKIHQEMKDVPGYALTVAKGGFKLKPVPEGTCAQPDPNDIGPRVLTAAGVFTGTPDPGDKPLCTGGVGRNGANLTYDVTGQSLDRVSRTLSGLVLARPVVDRTGITGQFSFHVEFENIGNVLTPPGAPPVDPSDPASAASIFTVFEKQLGLKLEAEKVPQGSLAIDRLERPTPDGGVQAAAATRQRFDAASIKPCAPEDPLPGNSGPRGTAGGTNASISPGRFNVPCVTLEQLIYLAYASYGAPRSPTGETDLLANDYLGTASDATKVRGGPAWVHSSRDKYTIEATAPASVSDRATLMGAMLRTLLEDRFHLVIHREAEDVPMYALRVAKSGLTLKPMKEGDCDPNLAGTPPPWKGTPCGYVTNGRSGLNTTWHYVGFQLGFLARQLSGPLGRHVIDETGVTGEFIINLEFQTDDTKAPDVAGDPASAPSIFTAVEQQLGLKLEPVKAPRGFIVIDRAERPTPNAPEPARAQGAGH